MINLDLGVSPIQSCYMENIPNLFIKREDCLPFSFGGNKLRICLEFLKDMQTQQKNCMIGYGSLSSNLCRVLANLCSYYGIKCFIVYAVDDRIKPTFNSELVSQSGAEIITCSKQHIAETIDAVFKKCDQLGLNPYYINGNKYGIGNEHVYPRGYCKVYREILKQERQLSKHFDYIFLPSGTGMTQSGLIVGVAEARTQSKIIGISVSRESFKQSEIILNYLNKYTLSGGGKSFAEKDVCVLDDYLCGGYGKYNQDIKELCKKMFCLYGIPMDTTYVGKAFYGMINYINKEKLNDKNILFLNTGGLPLFFEQLKEQKLHDNLFNKHS